MPDAYTMTRILTIIFLAAAGHLSGRVLARFCGARRSLARSIMITLVLLPIVIFLSGFAARHLTDTATPYWRIYEAWAFTGRWLSLLFCVYAMLAFAVAHEGPSNRKAILITRSLVLLVVVLFTMPLWMFLGDGRRDGDGYMRQTRNGQYTCAPVALANYLEQFAGHAPVTERQMARLCRTTLQGTTTANLIRAAQISGLDGARAVMLDTDALHALGQPAIIKISTVPGMRHATLFVNWTPGAGAIIIDPSYGRKLMKPDHFRGSLYGRTLLLGEAGMHGAGEEHPL